MSSSINMNEKASLIWAIADKLTGVYKPHEYGEVILPMTVLRRFDCILSDTKEAVKAKNKEVAHLPMKDILLKNEAKHPFYNVSEYDFQRLTEEPENIEANFTDYINGFSENVQDIIRKFKFEGHIQNMTRKGILYIVVKEFTTPNANLHPDYVSNIEMGYIFEEIIRRFSEAHNEDAGQHYTPREVIELMVNILFYDDNDVLSGNNVAKTIYDPACGTGGMLSVAEEYLHTLNKGAELMAFGQEINDQTFAICKADMLIKGNNADFIKDGNTLSDDQFAGQTFDYIISNPPFGREWKNEKAKVEAEAKKGYAGRFAYGLPAVGDGQLLFLMTAISKMKQPKDGGSRIAIIHNGSPLFTGDAGSGPSEIRKHIIENDLLEAIIALPNEIFYNTGIGTYIWVLSNKKKGTPREGKIQLINGNSLFEKRAKSLGNKRNDIPESAIEEITKAYGDMAESSISKIFDNADFGYSKITVERPLLDEDGKPELKKGKPQPDTSLRDTENVPLTEDIQEYFRREVLPFAPDSWIDESKTKVGYEIPFTKHFYEYEAPKPSDEIMQEIFELKQELNRNELLFDSLNNSLNTKGTGIDWIGDIPVDWQLQPLKYSIKIRNEKISDTENYIGMENIESGTGKTTNLGSIQAEKEALSIKKGDIIFGKLRPYLAKTYRVENDGCCSTEFMVSIPENIDGQFLEYLYLSDGFIQTVNMSTYGTKMPRASTEFIKNLKVALPIFDKQRQIADYLDQKRSEIDDNIQKYQQMIEKLTEYKKSLIFEVVTGKKEV